LAVVLSGVQIDATDGGGPALLARRVAVRPKLFGLLSGKLAIDQIDIDAPRARVVVENGELKNLAVKLPEKKEKPDSGPFHAPFRSISVTDGAFDVSIDGTHLLTEGVDLDVSTQDDSRAGS